MRVQLGVGDALSALLRAQNDRTRARWILWASLLGAIVLLAIAAIAVSTERVASDAGPTPPPFSRRIATAFPGAPFVTCDLGQFEDISAGESAPHRWYIRPTVTGDLRVDVHALLANPAEGGALSARLYDARGRLVVDALVPYLAGGRSSANVVPLRAAVVASAIYRLEVRAAPAAGAVLARHYRLGFSGIPVEVGVNSAALPHWLEGLNLSPQVFHVNVDAGEELRLTLTAGEGQPIPSMTIEVRDEAGGLLHTVTSLTRDPFDVVLAPSGARTLRLVTFGNHHFSLDKRSGSDRGIYFDTCPNLPRG